LECDAPFLPASNFISTIMYACHRCLANPSVVNLIKRWVFLIDGA